MRHLGKNFHSWTNAVGNFFAPFVGAVLIFPRKGPPLMHRGTIVHPKKKSGRLTPAPTVPTKKTLLQGADDNQPEKVGGVKTLALYPPTPLV